MDIETVKKTFESWLDRHNSKIHPVLVEYKGYLPPDEQFGVVRPGQAELPNGYIPYPIQQVEKEIIGLAEVILDKCNQRENAVEIGMGGFGGTHTLWSLLFDNVYTIEIDAGLIQKYRNNNSIDTGHQFFINKSSHDESVLNIIPMDIDFLFIDGDHSYNAVRTDFSIYYPFVRSGGIVGFHDTKSQKYGVDRLMREMASEFDIKNLWFSDEVGISYFVKE